MTSFENITDFFSKIPSLHFGFTDLLDILLVTFVLYNGIKLIRETRAFQLVKGLVLLGIAYLVVYQLEMQASTYMFRIVFQNIFIVLIILFQQEIRQIIERLGKSKFSSLGLILKGGQNDVFETVRDSIIEIAKAVQRMSDSKTGSLIVMEKEMLLGDVIKTGTPVDAHVSHELIGNIFFPKSPLHDGAAVVRNGRLLCAGCVLPLTKSDEISSDLGTRHRAAIGMSEQSDAMIVVTSEETGTISVAFKGELTRNLTEAKLREMLIDYLIDSPDNRFLLVFSLLTAVVIWLVVAVVLAPEKTVTVKNVPVTIDYAKIEQSFGLKSFGETQFTVDITITGKRYIVESDKIADDLVVTANTGYVNSVGTYTLHIDVSSNEARPLYDIDSYSLSEIDVYFDYPKEKEFVIEPQIEFSDRIAPDGYYVGDYIFPESNTVKVTGPETQVNKIEKVVARAQASGMLRQSITVDANLAALTKDGETPKYITYNRQSEVVQVTVPVYKIATLPVECSFSGKPSDYVDNVPFDVTISPSSAEFAVPEAKLSDMKSFEIASIDFTKLTEGTNTFTVAASEVTGGIVIDKALKFTVTVEVSGMKTLSVAAPKTVSFINAPEGAKVELVSLNFSDVTVVGPQASLDALGSAPLAMSADLSAVKEKSDVVSVPVTFTDNDCWAYGEYTAIVKIS